MGEAYLRRYGILVTGECPKGGEHTWQHEGTAADCYNTGISYDYCTKCQVIINESVVPITHIGHKVIDDEWEGSCQKQGYITFHYECDCGEYSSESETRETGFRPCVPDPNSGAVHPVCLVCGKHLY